MSDNEAPGKFTVANGLRYHYLEYGQGSDHLVICHGIMGAAENWAEYAGRLGEHYHVIVPDLRGHGYSEKPEWGYSLVDYARDIADLIRSLKLGRPALLGHSMGARIALQVAAHHSESIRAAIAEDPPVSGPGRPRYPFNLDAMLGRRKLLEARGLDAAPEVYPDFAPDVAAVRAKYALMYEPNSVLESWFGFHLEDAYPLVAAAKAPTLLLYGDRGVVPEDAAQALSKLNPRVKVRRITNATHQVHSDNWPEFVSALRGFIDDPAQRPPKN